MPKIRLTAIASDIKGKANGSVFSSNSGGTYFRNNPNGGGRKSPKWDVQKNKFGSLASQWKSLTDLEQQSWQDMTTSYPTTNQWGDQRIPSGYELFMKLNGSLSSAGFQILRSPVAPRSIPSIGSSEVNYPEYFQLNPNRGCKTYNYNQFDQARIISCKSFFSAVDIMNDNTFSMRVKFSQNGVYPFQANTSINIFSADEKNDHGMWFKGATDSNGNMKFVVVLRFTTGSADYSADLTSDEVLNGFHFSFFASKDSFASSAIFINGLERGGLINHSGNLNNTVLSCEALIGNDETTKNSFFTFSDFRWYQNALTSQEHEFISLGYVLDTERTLVPAYDQNSKILLDYGSSSPNGQFESDISDSNDNLSTPVAFGLIPKFSIIIPNEGLSGMFLNVYASAPISNGVNGSFSNFKKIGIVEWLVGFEFSVDQMYKSVFSNVPANSQVLFQLQVLDSTTGQMSVNKPKPRKKVPRFRAGVELTDKIN